LTDGPALIAAACMDRVVMAHFGDPLIFFFKKRIPLIPFSESREIGVTQI